VQRDSGKDSSKGTATTTIDEPQRETYDVDAETLEDFEKAISKRKEAGDTDWTPVYNYDQEDGKVTNVTVTVTIKVTMPNWPGAAKLKGKAKAEWDRFYKALEAHEQGHVKIAQEQFKGLAEKMLGKKEADAKKEFEKAKKAAKDASDKYDKSNDHGRKQGTIIDVDAGKDEKKSSTAPSTEPTYKPGSAVPPTSDASDSTQPENEEETAPA
jgi:predicted secreted Zn-dependent protease